MDYKEILGMNPLVQFDVFNVIDDDVPLALKIISNRIILRETHEKFLVFVGEMGNHKNIHLKIQYTEGNRSNIPAYEVTGYTIPNEFSLPILVASMILPVADGAIVDVIPNSIEKPNKEITIAAQNNKMIFDEDKLLENFVLWNYDIVIIGDNPDNLIVPPDQFFNSEKVIKITNEQFVGLVQKFENYRSVIAAKFANATTCDTDTIWKVFSTSNFGIPSEVYGDGIFYLGLDKQKKEPVLIGHKFELMDRVHCIQTTFEALISSHPAAALLKEQVEAVQDKLSELYQAAGSLYTNTPESEWVTAEPLESEG
jgi:hypothetical protein